MRIVSGGQSGVDRGALDAAVHRGVPYGGWCPRGGSSEDLADVRVRYPCLHETPSPDVSQRTLWNVRDSDATLVIVSAGVHSPGTELTISFSGRCRRPLLVTPGDAGDVRAWLDRLERPSTLNVAGPRASEWPEGYAVAFRVLCSVLRR